MIWRLFAGMYRVLVAILCLVLLWSLNANAQSTPDQIGQWSSVITWPIVAVHMNMMHNGKILAWEDHSDNPDAALVWDPIAGTFTNVPTPGINLFCAGHCALFDGRMLVDGGHVGLDIGIPNATAFDPVTQTWTSLAPMNFARWYPTMTALPDGRLSSISGSTTCETCNAYIPEIYTSQTNSWSQLANAPLTLPLYPFVFVLPDGRLLISGSSEASTATYTLDVNSQTWTTIDPSVVDGGSAAMYLPGKVIKCGTSENPDVPVSGAVANTYVLDMNQPSPSWRQTASMSFPRVYHTLTLLPDGNVLVTGGGTDPVVSDLTAAVKQAELWSPTTETWTTMASMQKPRLYHSTAILLPDGRVAVAGSGRFNGPGTTDPNDQRSAEIYSPPYLFKGARPTITTAPASVNWGTNYFVGTPDAAGITKVSLIRLGSDTHAFNCDQRYLSLAFQQASGGLTITSPANGNLAPPGYYMLFLVNSNGVPSVGSFVQVLLPPDAQPPTTPGNLNASASAGSVSLTWTGSSDNVAVTGYAVYGSVTPGFAPTSSNMIALTPSNVTSYTDRGLTPGTYYYLVRAQDAAGNLSTPSSQATATITAGASILVAAYSFNAGSGSTAADLSGNGITGTINGATWTTQGKYGNALSFNGSNNYVDLGTPASFQITGSMTWSAWVKAAANPADDGQIVAGSDDNSGFQLKTTPDTGVETFGVAVSGISTTHTQRYSTTVRSLNTWYHVAGVYNATAQSLDIYVNGVLDNGVLVGTIPGRQIAPNINVFIGQRTNGYLFNGVIDEVRIYNGALTQAEVQRDMNTPLGSSASPPPPPVLATPSNGATGIATNPTLTWNTSTGATSYRVQVSTDPAFGTTVADQANIITTSYAASGLAPSTVYYWHVNATNTGGTSAYSTASSFTTVAPPPPPAPPVLATPANGATGVATNPTLTWNASTGATSYHLQVSVDPGFATTVVDQSNITTTSSAVSGLTGNTLYYWHVNATNVGGTSAYSTAFSFTTVAPPPPPPPPVLATPANGATGVATSPTLTWNASTSATSYRVQVSTDPAFGSTVADQSNITTTSFAAGGLTPNTTYYWHVNATNIGGTSAYSTASSFTTIPTPAGLVAAYAFDEGTGTTVADASGHGLTGTITGATWTTQSKYGKALSFDGTTSYVDLGNPTALQLTGSMTWSAWINAGANPADDGQIIAKSDNSTGWQFKTTPDTGPETFGVAVSGTAGTHTQRYSTTVRALNTWYFVAGVYNATAQTLDIYVNGALNNGTLVGTVPASQLNSSFNVNIGRRSGGFYFNGIIDEVRIYNRALTQAEIQTDMNTPLGLPPSPPAPPVLATPANGATGVATNPTLTWNASTGATSYHLQVSVDPGFAATVVDQSNVTTTSSAVSGLTGNTQYYWHVNASNTGGTSAYSMAFSFTTVAPPPPPAPPVLATPANGATGVATNPTLAWNASTGATSYHLQVSVDPGFATTVVDQSNITTTSSAVSGLAGNTQYYWHVNATNTGGTSAYSTAFSFTTVAPPPPPAPPVLATPADGATGVATNPTLTWNASTGATSYHLQVSVDPGFATTVVDQSSITTTSSAVSGLTASTLYYWHVNASNVGGTSAYSTASSFTTASGPPPPPPPVLATPANGATGIATNPTLTWNTSTGATSYHLQVSTDATFSTTIVDQANITTTSSPLSALATSATYFWRVSASNTGGTSSYSPTSSFNTVAVPAGLVAAYAFDAGTGTTAADASGNNITGTLSGATWTTQGKYSNALSFNGTTSYVNLANPTSLRLTGSMTLSAWVNASANPPDDGQIISKSNGFGWQFKTSPDTGPHTFAIEVSPTSTSTTTRYSTTVRALNTWYHVAGVYNATAKTLDIYVNGVLDNGVLLGTIPASQYNSGQNVNIGRRIGGFYFNGIIDEVRVYNRALTQAEIQTDMNTPLGAPLPPQLATPSNGATGLTTSPTLIWNASPGAATYHLQVSTSATFGTTVVDQAAINSTSFPLSGLTANSTYYWHVSATNTQGASAYSIPWNFTMASVVTRPLIVGVEAQGHDASVTITWKRKGQSAQKLSEAADVSGAVTHTATTNSAATFRVSAVGEGSLSYQWQRDGVDIPGAHGPLLVFTPGNPQESSVVLRCVVSNPNGADTTVEADVSFHAPNAGPNALPSVATAKPVPTAYALEQNYPNPFNPSTTIQYAVPAEGHVRLQVFNVLGELVATLEDQDQAAGYYQITFDAGRFASGIYIYRIQASATSRQAPMESGQAPMESGQAGGFTQAKKLLLLR